jgi:hypothetical protein
MLSYNPSISSGIRSRSQWACRKEKNPSTAIDADVENRLCDELDNTAGLSNLLLRQLADPSRLDDDGDFGKTALAEDLGVAEREEVDDGDGVALVASEVGVTGLGGDKRPELKKFVSCHNHLISIYAPSYLVQVDHRLPEVVLLLVEVPHTNLTEVTRVVLVDVGSVVVLTTSHTTTTGVLAVLADTTLTGRDVATAIKEVSFCSRILNSGRLFWRRM